MKNILLKIFLISFLVVILTLSIRGNAGKLDISEFSDNSLKDNGPFELSPERGRFALTYSLFEDKSPFFSLPVARFATPDLGTINGKYVSLFAPGVSFIVAPGYLIGKQFGMSQVGTYTVISILAVLNAVLIMAIATKLKANKIAAAIASLTFLFATPAYAYAVTLYQHHVSTFLILLSIYILIRFKNLLSLTAIWFLCFLSVPVDYPNLILMFPIGFYALGRILIFKKIESHLNISFKALGMLTFVSIIIPITFFLWFNKLSYNNPLQLSGTIITVKVIDENGKPLTPAEYEKINSASKPQIDPSEKKTAVGFFKTRNILNGLDIHLTSPDRGIVVFTPVMLLSIIGAISLYKKEQKLTVLLAAIIAANIVLYSMWSDPWGGWAFGSRYLIPSYALLSIFIAFTLTSLKKKTIGLIIFTIFLCYSLAVNALGALTSSRIPPKGEAKSLEPISNRQEKYSYDRDIDFLIRENRSKSFVYQTYLSKYLPAWKYYLLVIIPLISISTILVILLRLAKGSENA